MIENASRLVVLDSNVISYIFHGSTQARYYLERIRGLHPLIAFQTLEEIWYGAESGGWGERRRNQLAIFLSQYEVVYPDAQMVEVCARLRGERRRAGREIRVADAWVAATALILNCPLASHDGDFADIPGMRLIRASAM